MRLPPAGLRDVTCGLALAAGSAALRWGMLDARGLNLDDAWVALVSRVSDLEQFWMVSVQAPGFTGLLKLWFLLFDFSDATAQRLSWALGVAGPLALYGGLRWAAFPPLVAFAAGAMLATSPVHVAMSGRVKQYTLDAFCASVLVAAALRLLDAERSAARWRAFVVTAAIVSVLSTPCAISAAAALGALWLLRAVPRPDVRQVAVRPSLVLALVLGAWALLVWPSVNPALVGYWSDFYLATDGGLAEWARRAGSALRAIVSGLHASPLNLALLAVASLVAAAVQPIASAVLLAPLVLSFTLSAGRMLPVGTGRTDVFLYPWLAALVAVALRSVGRRLPAVTVVAAAAIAIAPLISAREPARYPSEDVAPLVATVEHEIRDGDLVVLNDGAAFAFPLYSRWPVRLVSSDVPATGFYPRVDHAAVWRHDGVQPLPVAAGDTRRVWLVTSHSFADVPLLEIELAARGYDRVRTWHRTRASLSLWR